jgi:hypothetical protein
VTRRMASPLVPLIDLAPFFESEEGKLEVAKKASLPRPTHALALLAGSTEIRALGRWARRVKRSGSLCL